jgi:hypothetical protein
MSDIEYAVKGEQAKELYVSYSLERVEYGHEFCGTWNQE